MIDGVKALINAEKAEIAKLAATTAAPVEA